MPTDGIKLPSYTVSRSMAMSASGQTRPRRSPAAVTAIPPTPDSIAASRGDRSGPLSDKARCSKAAYSITSLALACSVSGTVRPSPLAVFLLITSTNLLGNWTGRSAGLAPLKMRSMYPAA